ncbi:MAG: hypothetical protein JJU41_03220 [Bacteroidetes bacterium]|nr:hypothetical protein [Bacteroidota bacterium]MCH8524481.1 DUF294 nucleotidyltransferase-like domain-containing protein [Balneolales bacterium]
MTQPSEQPEFYALLEPLSDILQHPDDVQRATGLITDFADSVLQKRLAQLLGEMGEPPVPWALALFGSEGRKEQTLRTDQDNAIILSDEALDNADIIAWFTTFGKALNDALNASGYRYCNGGIMAGNTKWCVPISTWKQYFRRWVREPSPMAVMQSTIFFDIRHGAGDRKLTQELQLFMLDMLSEKQDLFFYHMVQNSLNVQVPPASLRKLWLWFYPQPDLKHLSLPISSAARIMALRNGITEQHTGRRLQELFDLSRLQPEKAHTLATAYDQLTWLRLRAQITAIRAGEEPKNTLRYNALSSDDRTVLLQALDGVLLARTMLRNAIGAYF